jgi:hypothetical protein
LKGKAGNYTLIEAKATVLDYKVKGIKTEVQLQALQEELYELILEAGRAETDERV